MPRGYPDYFGHSIFPKYGSAQWKWGVEIVPSLSTVEIVKVTGKGVLTGGWVYLTEQVGHEADDILLYVDGRSLVSGAWKLFFEYSFTSGCNYFFTVSRFNNIEGNFTGFFNKEYSFEQGLILKYTASAVGDSIVHGALGYYNII